MHDILKKEIILTELGHNITTTLLLSNPSPYLITFVLFMKENNGCVKVRELFDRYVGNSIGNVGYLSYVINDGVNYDLFEFKK